MTRWISASPMLAVASLASAAPSVARGQAANSVRTFSLFGGTAFTNYRSTPAHTAQVEAGASADWCDARAGELRVPIVSTRGGCQFAAFVAERRP